MIALLLILIQSHLFAAPHAPGCQDLSRIVSEAEKNLMNSSLQSCAQLDIAAILPREITHETIDYFSDYRCSPLYQVETQIAELENQEALLLGFEKLKNQVASSQDDVSTLSKQEEIQKAAGEFAQALNTAQSIEIMLNSKIPNQDLNFLQLLAAEKPELWGDLQSFQALTLEFCTKVENGKSLPVCSSDFVPNEKTHEELTNLLRTGGLSQEESEQWKRSLSIQRADGSEYSFVKMTDSITKAYTALLKGETLDTNQLESIRALDKFRSNPQFSFAKKLPAPKGNNLVQAKIKHHIQSLKKRQEVEVNTKMSMVAALNKDLMDDGEKATCSVVQVLSELDASCLNALNSTLERAKKTRADDQTAQLSMALASFSRSQDYIAKLGSLSEKCETDLNQCAANLPLDLATLSDKLSALRVIKEAHGKEQMTNMTFRNFALSKWTNNCSEQIDVNKTIVEECNETLSQMSPEMYKLSSSLLDISILIDPKKINPQDDETRALCENEDVKKLADQKKLCVFFTDKVSDELPLEEKPKVDADTYVASVSAPKGSNKTREAWLQGLAHIANAGVDSWIGNRNASYFNNPINPYMYNFAPSTMKATMGTADTILFNARHYGAYGFYLPTQGLQTHTAFGSKSISSYSPSPRSGGSYSYFSP